VNFSLEYPIWYVLICVLVAAAFTWILYGRKETFSELNLWLKRLLVLLRFSVLFLLSFLLLSPLLSTNHREVQKPKVILLRDNSNSILGAGKKDFYTQTFPSEWGKLGETLGAKYDVSTYSFGSQINKDDKADYSEKITDLSEAISEVKNLYANQNLGAIILATDGIYNQGSSPLYEAKDLGIPIYTVGLGDTLTKKDILINTVSHNKYAYLGNNFPVEATVEAKLCQGSKSIVKIMDETGTIRGSQEIQVTSNRFQKQVSFLLKAEKSGMQHYTIQVESIGGEITKANNTADVYIEVLDGRQKVLILNANPHPDVAAIKNSIESNQNYEVETSSAENFKKNLLSYNLVILHAIPATNGNGQTILQELIKSEVPSLFIIGSNSSIANYNQLENGVNIQSRSNTTNETQALFNRNFTLFTLSPTLVSQLEKFPPLISPFGDFKVSPGSQSLLNQKIGSINTENPLVLFGQNGNRKTGTILGENCWKWRLADFNQNNTTKNFDELFSKIVQYLAVKQDKSQFRILTKNKYQENEPVLFEAEIYNDSYELINTAEVNVVVSNAKGKKYQFTLGKTDNAYRLDAGVFPPGNYVYEANAKFGEKTLKANGKFVVSEIKLELLNNTADHQLLRALSASTNGQYYTLKNYQDIAQKLLNTEQMKPVIYNYSTFDEAIHLKWIFGLILLLLALEWFIRKWGGAY
jgi:hypothetical protein